MSGVLLRLADLAREPEFHLDELLDVLRQVPDGYKCQRIVLEETDAGDVNGWDLDVAWGYSVEVNPEYQCGFSGAADAPILITVAERVQETEGASMKMQTRQSQCSFEVNGRTHHYTVLEWRVQVQVPGQGKGEGVNDHLGVAALLAYLRAWGVVE